jgi:hypothetical protein
MHNKNNSAKHLRLHSCRDQAIRDSLLLETQPDKSAKTAEIDERLLMSRRPTRLSLALIKKSTGYGSN